MSVKDPDIYDPQFVKGVFDRCSRSYRYWSYVASFGFTERWRSQCIQNLPKLPESDVQGFDIMAGTGEAWSHLFRHHKTVRTITAVDISSGMHERALDRLHSMRQHKIGFIEADVLSMDIQSASADFVISTFGMKTFNSDQHTAFARELARILKPGGVFSIVEASEPRGWILHGFYMFYLKKVLPLIERLFLNGAQDFSMLGIYAENFQNCQFLAEQLKAQNLKVEYKEYFFGCASGVIGIKPTSGLVASQR